MNLSRIIALGLAALLLTGCAGITDVRQDQLYAPKPLNVASKTPAAVTTYRQLLKAAENAYEADALKAKPTPAVLIDTGIVAANANCRAWFAAVSDAERRFVQGQGNVGVVENAITAILGLAKASSGLVAAYGIGATAFEGYSSNYHSSVLSLGQHDIQSAVKNVMVQRANELRAQASSMTFPQAVDALDGYSRICSPETAIAITKSALSATTVTVDQAGALRSVVK